MQTGVKNISKSKMESIVYMSDWGFPAVLFIFYSFEFYNNY